MNLSGITGWPELVSGPRKDLCRPLLETAHCVATHCFKIPL